MFNWLLNKIFKIKIEQAKRAYDAGLRKGFDLGCQYERDKGFIVGGMADKQIEEILKKEGI